MTFEQLRYATTLRTEEAWYYDLVTEWNSKREALQVQLLDIPFLVTATKEAAKEPYSEDPRITLKNQVPGIRLTNACEAITNTLYGMAEIAASFGSRVSSRLPANFNPLRKKAREGKLDRSNFR